MTELLQTNFNFNRQSYMIQPDAVKKQELKADDNLKPASQKAISKNDMLMYTLGGLAVLGSVAAIIKSHNSARKHKTSQKDPNIMETLKLRTRIKNKFTEKRAPIVNRLLEEIANFNPDYKFMTISQINAMKMKMDAENTALETRLVKHKAESLQLLKNKISNLSSDNEWQGLRKLRKNYIKTLKSKASAEKKQIANKKIIIINDLLINKAYPEEVEAFKQLYKIDPADALEFVKKDTKTLKDYNEEFKAAQKLDIPYSIPVRDRNFTHILPLKLIDVFPDEALAYNECESKLKYINRITTRLDEILNKYKEDISKIVDEFRNSVEVKALKAAIKEQKKIM